MPALFITKWSFSCLPLQIGLVYVGPDQSCLVYVGTDHLFPHLNVLINPKYNTQCIPNRILI